jgi:hypothetical protein
MSTQDVPAIQRIITRVIAEAGGAFPGTGQLCEAIPATRNGVLYSLRNRARYGLLRCHHNSKPHGRGHKTVWTLTAKGRKYVEQHK